MKVLHILYSGLGGHGNVFFSMVNADIEKCFTYEGLFVGIEDMREEYKERCNNLAIPYSFIKKDGGKHLNFFYEIYRAVRKSDAEIIFIHGGVQFPPAWLAKVLSGKKRKLVVRETQALHLKAEREKIALSLAMRLADNVVFLSDAYNKQIKSDFGRSYNAKIAKVIPNGIDLNIFKPVQRIPDEIIRIGMQSRIVAIKDHLTLIDAFDEVKKRCPTQKIKLYIAGDGDKKTELENKVRDLQLHEDIVFEGMLPEKDLASFLAKLDIYVHASFGETMSTAIMQAMACGKAIVASDVDGINNMIEDKKTGLLVKIKDVSEMADALESLIKDKQLKNSLEEEALKVAQEKFSDRQMFLKYKTVFQS